MPRYTVLKTMVLQHRSRLLLTYTLFSLEMLGTLMRPYFLGEAVNGLLKGSYNGVIILSAVHLAWLTIGTLRQRYDTRTYSTIYTSLVTRFLSRRIERSDISRLSAHSTLSRELVDFMEFDLVYVIEAAYNILGSMVLLFFYQPKVVMVCFAILLPVLAISYFYGKKMRKLNKHKNDELEKQVDIISTGNIHTIRKHYNTLRQWQIRISDQEAWNFGMLEILVMLVIGLSLFVTTGSTSTAIEAGSLIGIYNYILKFVSGLDTIPYTIQRLSTLNDIVKRIELQAEDLPDENQHNEKTKPFHVIGLPEVSAS
jgi:ABC-type multidrug transport system fused ATPase/permease subunit